MKIKRLAGAALGVSLAAAADDAARCYNIRDKDLRNACLADTRGDKSRCYSIQDADAEQLCLARLTGDKSRCYNVRDKDCARPVWREWDAELAASPRRFQNRLSRRRTAENNRMTAPAERLATYRDLFDLPDNVIGEILHGQLIAQPRPAPRHARAASVLGGDLMNPFDHGRGGPGGWWILFEPELHLGAHILVPDLAGWRRERMPVFPDEAYFTLAPDWVCEVLSPGTVRIDRVVKMPLYAEHGVGWLWLVDPDQRTLEVFRLLEGHWLMEQAWQQNEEVGAPPFGEWRFALADLWVPEAT